MGNQTDHSSQDAAFTARCFKILEDVAHELSGEVVFPTCFDAVLEIRNVLHNPDVSLAEVAQVVGMEPLIATKLLKIANATAYNPGGKAVTDVEAALQRIGINVARSAAMAVAMDQLRHSKSLYAFGDISTRLWTHSLRTAVTARVLARRLTRINAEDAMLAGLVHDLGAFLLVYRLANFPEFRDDTALAVDLIGQWHEGVGESLLASLGLPEHIIDAVRDHDQPRPVGATPTTLAEVIYVANRLAGGCDAWRQQDASPAADLTETYAELAEEIDTAYAELAAALGGN